MSDGLSLRVARWLIAWRWPLLAIGAMLAAVAYFPAQGLKFDRSIENMFAADDPLLEPYRQLKRTFGGNEIVLAAYIDPELMTAKGIERLDALTRELRGIDGVASVMSLTATPLGKSIIEKDSKIAQRFLELFENFTVSEDRRTAAVP